MSERITLATMDGETMEVDKEIAMKSVLIRGIVEDSGVEVRFSRNDVQSTWS